MNAEQPRTDHERGSRPSLTSRYFECDTCGQRFAAYPHPIEGWASAESPGWVAHVLAEREKRATS